MMNLKKFWTRVRELEKTLPETVWLTNSDGKHMSEAGPECAAEAIISGLSRLATDVEISMFKARRSVLDSQWRDAAGLRNRGGFRLEVASGE